MPPEAVDASGEGATDFEDIEGGGIGEGEGMKDVSEQIEHEEQVWNYVSRMCQFLFRVWSCH